jgi:hypothetical protein
MKYHLKDDKLALYLCSTLIAEVGQATDPDHENTNLAYINFPDLLTFYLTGDQKTAIIGRSDFTKLPPTIPDFDIPVPDGTYDGNKLEGISLGTSMVDGQSARCDLSQGDSFECEGVSIAIGSNLLTVDPLIVTNKAINPETDKCSSFVGEGNGLVGSGTFGDAELTLVAYSKVTVSDNVKSLVGALIVAQLDLELVE